METLIKLKCTKSDAKLLGFISDMRLKNICQNKDILFLEVVWMVLGKKFCFFHNKTNANSNISSQFLASLLDLNMHKVRGLVLLRMVFVALVLEEDLNVVVVVRLGVGIPFLDGIVKMF